MLSIIIPVYNGENHIVSCLDSLELSQFPDLEVIVVDDGSKDRTSSIVSQYQSQCSNLKFIKYKDNKGVSHARNVGLDNASKYFVMFIDSDDVLLEGSLALILETLKQDETKLYKFTECLNENKGYTPREALSKMSTSDIFNALHGNIYINELAKETQFKEQLTMAEDLLFNFQYLKKLNRNDKISVICENVYDYVVRAGSITQTYDFSSVSTRIRNIKNVYSFILEEMGSSEQSSRLLMNFQNKYEYELIRQYANLFKDSSIKKEKRLSVYEDISREISTEKKNYFESGNIVYDMSFKLFKLNKDLHYYYNVFMFGYIWKITKKEG